MNDNQIKSLVPTECPHCGKDIIASFKMEAPTLTGILTVDMIEQAKGSVVAQIGALQISMDDKQPLLDWVNSPDTIFGPGDVEEIINNIKKQNATNQEVEA